MPNPNPYNHLTLQQLEAKVTAAQAWLQSNKRHPRFFEYLTKFSQLRQAFQDKDQLALREWHNEVAPALKSLMEPPTDPKAHPWDVFTQKQHP